MHLGRTTLSKFLIQQSDRVEGASDLAALLIDVAAAVKAPSDIGHRRGGIFTLPRVEEVRYGSSYTRAGEGST